ncbi:hypothetical protein IAT38_007483 [Cryptococcus sp. DSM 104549]
MSLQPARLPHLPYSLINRQNRPSRRLRPPSIPPFFLDPDHTIPTKWSLYRPLLRLSARLPHPKTPSSTTAPNPNPNHTPYPHIHEEVKSQFRRFKPLTSPAFTRTVLTRYLDLLSALRSSDIRALEELESRLAVRKEARLAKEAAAAAAREAAEAARPRPRLTGGFHRPTLFNPPLPRMKPQPMVTGIIIRKRIRRRQTRMDRQRELAELEADMVLEGEFEDTLIEGAKWKAEMEKEHRLEEALLQAADDSLNESTGKEKGDRKSKRKGQREAILEDKADAVVATRLEGSAGVAGWKKMFRAEIGDLADKFTAERQRAAMMFTPRMMEAIQRAKEGKEAWLEQKRRERKAKRAMAEKGEMVVGMVGKEEGEGSGEKRKSSGEKGGSRRQSAPEVEEQPAAPDSVKAEARREVKSEVGKSEAEKSTSRSRTKAEATSAADDPAKPEAEGGAKKGRTRKVAATEEKPTAESASKGEEKEVKKRRSMSKAKAEEEPAKVAEKDGAEEGTDGAKRKKVGATTRKTAVKRVTKKATKEDGEKGEGDGAGEV